VLFAYSDPVSPHLAAASEQRVVPDAAIVAAVRQHLHKFTAEIHSKTAAVDGAVSSNSSSSFGSVKALTVVETAGGITSPGPSGTLQVKFNIVIYIIVLLHVIVLTRFY
jgi:dethiobiotin synthetase/adenosylmethionine--8-amino-7-oxononanoate aminotransferase